MHADDAAHRARPGAPPGYREVRSPVAEWMARPECAEAIAQGEADFLFAPHDRRLAPRAAGRGRLARFRISGVPAVGKRALRGGLLGRLLGGLYVGRARGLAQIDLAERLERAGIPTAEILAVGSRRAFGPLHQQAIISRAIPRAQNLYEAAMEDAPWRRRRVILERSADLVRAMHDAGFLHADLNVSNLVVGEGAEGDRVHIVDLDRGRFLARVRLPERVSNLARLLRSYEKWIARRGRLSAREEILFLRRYCRSDRRLLRTLRKRLGRYRARLRFGHRPWWALTASGSAGQGRGAAQ